MNLILRFFWVLLTSRRRTPIAPLQTSELTFRVLPNDLDLNFHMNNGRYLTIMDLGRLDLILRNGIFRAMRRNGWNPVLSAARISYRRSLDPFQRYRLVTGVLGWDETSVYMEQSFVVDDRVYARGIIRAVFLSRGGRVPTRQLLESIGYGGPAPVVDQRVIDMLQTRETAPSPQPENA